MGGNDLNQTVYLTLATKPPLRFY